MTFDTVVVYSTDWCPDCTRSKHVLDRMGIGYAEIDIEKVSGGEQAMRAVNGGSGKVPTILIAGRVLVEPSDRELEGAARDLTKVTA